MTETRTIQADPSAETLTVRKYRLRWPTERGTDERTFDRRLVYVGSAPDSGLWIDHPTVSRNHCKLEVDRFGHRIRDLESKNGTWVNGMRVVEAYLPREATVRLGDVELQFRVQDEAVEVPLSRANSFGDLIGESLAMREIFALLARVAPTDTTVLVEGESGTGKELVAQALHTRSRRAAGPFVVFDCSAVPPHLLESELFGHVKGAFTGALSDRVGAFEEAGGGTLFIDEIGELSMELQPKLLRVLETREVKPVGANKRVRTNVRIVAATNRILEKEVQAGNFREDLFFRLAVIKVELPPLRKRVEDIPVLIEHFTRQFSQPGAPVQVSWETMRKLQGFPWTGNVRELRNFVERAALLSDTGRLETRFVRPPLQEAAAEGDASGLPVDYALPFKDAKNRLIEAFEKVYWSKLLAVSGGNISEAARQGGIHRKSLEYLLKKLDVDARGLA
ncbi:MAG: hypothetical protein AMXMBFR64_37820 [Myxococcales bacterium]